MPEHIVAYTMIDDWQPPEGERVLSIDPSGDGAWRVTTTMTAVDAEADTDRDRA